MSTCNIIPKIKTNKSEVDSKLFTDLYITNKIPRNKALSIYMTSYIESYKYGNWAKARMDWISGKYPTLQEAKDAYGVTIETDEYGEPTIEAISEMLQVPQFSITENVPANNVVNKILDEYVGKINTPLSTAEATRVEKELNRVYNSLGVKAKAEAYGNITSMAKVNLYTNEGRRYSYNNEGRLTPEIEKLLGTLKATMPGTKIVYSTFQEAKKNFNFKIPDNANSFILEDTVYIFTDRITEDTAVEEMLHPFVYAIFKNNNDYFLKLLSEAKELYPNLVKDVTRLYAAYPGSIDLEIVTQALTAAFKSEYESNNSKSVDRVKSFVSEFWQNLLNFINDLFGVYGGKLSAYHIPMDTTLGQLARIINTNGIELETVYNKMPQWNLGKSTLFVNQLLEKPFVTKEQKDTVEKLLNLDTQVWYDYTSEKYQDDAGSNFTRVSDFISNLTYNDAPRYFAYEGEEDDYQESKDWGNQIDAILEGILEGKSKGDIYNSWKNSLGGMKGVLSEDIVENLIDELTAITEELGDVVIIPQVTIANKEKGVAGRADLVLVYTDGTINVLDLKSGKVSTKSYDYTKTYGTAKSSKKQRQQAQLSAYKALFQSQGFKFNEENKLGIIPVFLEEINEENIVESYNIEDIVEVSAMQPILTDLNQDETYKGDTYIDDPIIVKQAETLLDKVKKLAEERLLNLEKQGGQVKNIEIKKAEVENLKKVINDAETLKSVENFINDAYNLFVTKKVGDRSFKGLVDTIRTEIKGIEKNSDDLTTLNNLLYYKNLVESYMPVIDDLSNFYYNFYDLDIKNIGEDHPINKIRQIRDAGIKIKSIYNDEILPKIADVLASQTSQELNASASEQYKRTLDQLNKLKTEGKSSKILENMLKKMENRNITEKGVDKDVILQMLREGSFEDISSIDKLLTPAISSSNSVVALFAKKLKAELEDARIKSMKFSKHASNAFERYSKGKSRDNVAEFNKDFYTIVSEYHGEDKEIKRYQFINPIDFDKFNKAKKEFYKSIEGVNYKERGTKIKQWLLENTEAISQEDITVKNPETGEITIIQKGQKTLIKEKRKLVEDKIWTELDYDNWVDSVMQKKDDGTVTYHNEFQQPKLSKYRDSKYDEIQNNPEKKRYYDFLISSHFESQNILPESAKLGYRIPSIPKNDNDRLRETGIIKTAKYKVKSFVSILPEDESEYGLTEGSIKTVPVLYHNYLDPEDVSLDLISSIMIFRDASYKHAAQSSMAGLAETTLDFLKTNTPYKTDTIGNKILDAAAAKTNIKNVFEKYRKKHAGNNVAALFEAFVDMQVYNKLSIPHPINTFFGTVDAGKLANTVSSFTSTTQLGGFNFIGSLSNNLTNRVSVSIEAAAKNYVNEKDWAKAEWEFNKNTGNMLKDFGSPINKSLLGQLVNLYDPMQGEFKDKYGRKVSHSVFKKLWSMDTHFFLMHQTDYSIQVTMMISQMLTTKVKQKQPDGTIKEIPLYQAYTLNDAGEITLKEGVTLNGKTDTSGLLDLEFQNRLHALNKRMFGVYNSFDKVDLERYWYGKLLLMYKKHIVPAFKRRYKGISRDEELGDITEGYHRTFFRLLATARKDMLNELTRKDSQLTPLEKQNLKKSLRDIMWVAATGTVILLLQGMIEGADDDDEKRALRYPLYLAMRLNADLGTYGTPGDPQNAIFFPNLQEMLRLSKNPSPVFGTSDKLFRLINQLFNPTEVYERDSGIWKKGDNKLAAQFLKFWGMSGTNFDPENSIKWLQMQNK